MTNRKNQLADAAAEGRWDLIKTLIERGDDPNTRINDSTLLMLAVSGGRNDMVTFLIGKGANVSAKSSAGLTPLHLAVQEARKEMVELLIANGADVNAKGVIEMTPLHIASVASRPDMAEILIAKGADPNARSRAGLTALHEAAANNNPEIVALLLQNGADPSIRANSHETAQAFAIRHGNSEVASLLAKPGNESRSPGFMRIIANMFAPIAAFLNSLLRTGAGTATAEPCGPQYKRRSDHPTHASPTRDPSARALQLAVRQFSSGYVPRRAEASGEESNANRGLPVNTPITTKMIG